MTRKKPHVVLIGGGITGASTAFLLAQTGLRVTLLDPADPGRNASGNNAGNLNPIYLTPPPLLPMALESFRLHQTLALALESLGCKKYCLQPTERILLAFDANETARLEEIPPLFERHRNFSCRHLDHKILSRLEPRISSDAKEGLLISGNLSLDGRYLTFSLILAAQKCGATIQQKAATGLVTKDGRAQAVQCGTERINCDLVVLATGARIQDPEQWLGVKLPLYPAKGEILRMKLPGLPLAYDLSHGATSLYRRGQDEIWIGVTHEEGVSDELPTPKARSYLLQQASFIMPEIKNALLLEHCAAVRPMSPSHLPLAMKLPEWKNIYLANGGGSKGILLGPGIADSLCRLILKETNSS